MRPQIVLMQKLNGLQQFKQEQRTNNFLPNIICVGFSFFNKSGLCYSGIAIAHGDSINGNSNGGVIGVRTHFIQEQVGLKEFSVNILIGMIR